MNNILQVGGSRQENLQIKTDIEHCNELTDMESAVLETSTWGTERKDFLTVSMEESF